jgi:hypothetical protein
VNGSQKPRIRIVPEGDEHPRWGEVLEVLDRLEIVLDPWQMDVLHTSLLRRGDVWAAFSVAVCCPRQNGKNEILQARELIGALVLDETMIIHSAHLADTCMEAFTRLDDLIDANAWLLGQIEYVRRTNGRELVKFHNGARLRFRTRTRSGGRGFSGSPVIFDEPMFLPVISQNSILPVLSAQPDPQAWYTGSAVDQREHLDGLAFARVREAALASDDDRLAYFEWSLDLESPEVLTEERAMDQASWAETNPALGIRITPEYIRAERGQLTPRGFAVERLGVGDWPDTSGLEASMFDIADWDELGHDNEIVGDRCVALDISPERRSSLYSVGVTSEGHLGLELIEADDGTAWVPDLLRELDQRGDVVEIVCDGYGPAASVATIAEEFGVKVRLLEVDDHAQACEMFVDRVNEGTIRHGSETALDAAVRGAKTRPLVDRWAWSRRNSRIDISPLVAATLAVFSAVERDIANSEVVIY